MKNKFYFAITILILYISCIQQNTTIHNSNEDLDISLLPFTGKKLTVYVLDLYNMSQYDDPRIGRGISQMLITALLKTDRFRVVERNENVLKQLFKEQELVLSGIIDSKTAITIGNLLGADAIVIGEISEFGIRKFGAYLGFGGTKSITTRVVIDCRLINTSTGEILLSKTGMGETTTNTSGAAFTFEFGTEGFDETTIGISSRKAVNQIARKFALYLN